jgi:DNA-binding CsgD family transcriptional regulator/predicted negative regulator of RcsB-dependent stress response
VIDACASQTGGNPFLLRELLTELPPGPVTPSLVRACGPANLARVVAARLAAAGAPAAALADAVAVLGDGIDLRVAARLAGLEATQATLAADNLARVGVFGPGRPVAFSHAILRQALYQHRPTGERALAHRAAARLLAREGASEEQVAAHLLRCEPMGSGWVVQRLQAAAGQALGQGAPDSAVAYLGRALREPPRHRHEILLELGRAEARVHHPDARAHLEQIVEGSRDAHHRAAAAVDLARLLLAMGQAAAATDVLDVAIAGLDRSQPELALRLECERLAAACGSLRRSVGAVERFEAAVALAPPVDDALARLVLAQRAVAHATVGRDRNQGVDLARKALAGGRLLAEEGCESASYYIACNVLAGLEQLVEACRHLGAAVADAQARASLLGYAFASTWRSWARVRAGDIRGAELDASAALEFDEHFEYPFNRATAASVLTETLLERGDFASARATLTEALTHLAEDQVTSIYLLHVAAQLRLLTGDHAGALEDALKAGRQSMATGYDQPSGLLPWRSTAALAHAALGDTDAARALVADELTVTGRFGAPRALGIALRIQALVGAPGKRVERLRGAVSVLEASEGRLEHARALVELGAALRRGGHLREARRPLHEGLDLAARCGASVLAGRARQELVAAGARPRRPALTGPDALTPAELRVAQHAAQDLSTREIAQHLFVTAKTVETHLTRAYRKLGISSRRELRAALAG